MQLMCTGPICVPVGCLQRFLKYGTALAAKTESDFNSVERVVQYLTPETEAAEETAPEVAARLPKDWPASKPGEVVCGFQGCDMCCCIRSPVWVCH